MKKNITQLLLVIPLVAIAVVANAYNAPGTYPLDTPVVPVTVGAVDQVKTGGLSVNAFIARDKAALNDTVFITGVVHGGTPSATDSTVYFGDASVPPVSVFVRNEIRSGQFLRSTALAGTGLRQTCADTSGKIIICP